MGSESPTRPPRSSNIALAVCALSAETVTIAHDDEDTPTCHQVYIAPDVPLFGYGTDAAEQLWSLYGALARALALCSDRIDVLGLEHCDAESGYHDGDEPMDCQRHAGHDGDHAGHGITWEQGWRAGLTDQPEAS